MSAKVANLIAVELGILIAILSALTVSSFRNSQPARVARQPARAIEAFAPVVSSSTPRRPAVNYPAEDLVAEQPSETQPAETVQEYEPPISTEGYADYGPDNGYVDEGAPYDNEVEPLFAPSDCLFPPVTQYVVYRQPTFVVFSNSRAFHSRFFGRRPRSGGGGMMMANRRPPMQPPRPRGTTMTSRRPTVQPPGPGDRRAAPRQDVQGQSARPGPKTGTRERR